MFRLARLSVATLLGLFMAITLLVPGAFAQHIDARHGSVPLPYQAMVVPMNHSSSNCGGCGWGGWDGGWGGWGFGWGW